MQRGSRPFRGINVHPSIPTTNTPDGEMSGCVHAWASELRSPSGEPSASPAPDEIETPSSAQPAHWTSSGSLPRRPFGAPGRPTARTVGRPTSESDLGAKARAS